jgi:hypothetical protein
LGEDGSGGGGEDGVGEEEAIGGGGGLVRPSATHSRVAVAFYMWWD